MIHSGPSHHSKLTTQSGIFRPEMLEPMGIPKNVRVLGWGMSCERPTMIK
jgi:phenylalanyl-tRNA synthetase alpha subunit